MRITILFIILLMNIFEANAASFDCGKASTSDEIAICGNGSLSDLDIALSSLYMELIHLVDLKKDQVEWIKLRRLCEGGVDCLHFRYTYRIEELKSIKELFNVNTPNEDLKECNYFGEIYKKAKRVCINNAEACLDLQIGNSQEFKKGKVQAFQLTRDWLATKKSVNISAEDGKLRYYFYSRFNGDSHWRTIETWVESLEEYNLSRSDQYNEAPDTGYKIADTHVMPYQFNGKLYSAVGHYRIEREYGGYYKTRGLKYLEIKRVYSKREPKSVCIFGS